MTARPVVGVVCCSRMAAGEAAQVVMDRYVVALMRHADCAALLVPARPDHMRASEVADRLDGLLLTGSPSNIDPARYGGDSPGEEPSDGGRDGMSIALIEEMLMRSRPILGICRGLQEINVAFGGTLRSDLGDAARPLVHHAPPGGSLGEMFAHGHAVELAGGGVLAKLFGARHLTVNSVHYQGIDRLGDGLSVEATAPDGVVEGVSADVGGAKILGVQWHPEWNADADSRSADIFRQFGRMLRGMA